MWIRAYDLFPIKLKDQSQHTVRCRMLRAEIDCIVPYFAVLGHVTFFRGCVQVILFIWIYRVAEAFVNRDEARACLLCRSFRGRSIVP